MSGVWQDVRYALRGFVRARGTAFVSVLTVGLGIAATAVIFSLVDALLLSPLPVEEMDRLVWVQELYEASDGGAPYQQRVIGHDRFMTLREGAASVGVDLAGFSATEIAFRGDGDAEGMLALFTTGNYFDALGVRPVRGRFFDRDEDQLAGSAPVVVVSDHLWRNRLGADPEVIGRTVFINSKAVTVVGVAPPEFGGTAVGVAIDIWLPIAQYDQVIPTTAGYAPRVEVFARLGGGPGGGRDAGARGGRASDVRTEAGGGQSPGIRAATTRLEEQLSTVARALPKDHPDAPTAAGVRLTPFTGLPEETRGAVTGFVLMLQIAAGLVLLIASINVGGVLLARAAARRHEIAVRLALGAGRRRLLRQLLTESTALFVLGGAAGLLLAVWGTRILYALEPPLPVRLSLELGLDARIIGVSLLLALLTGLVFGLAPALEAIRPDPAAALKAGARSGPGGGGRRRTRLRNTFVSAQIALSVILLCTAGLFTRALQRGLDEDLGFDPDGVIVASFDTRPHDYDEPQTRQFYDALLERVGALPGVTSASLVGLMPMPGTFYGDTEIEAVDVSAAASTKDGRAESHTVDVGYFETLRMPLLAGRDFSTADHADAPAVAVVNEAFTKRFWPGEAAVGRVFRAPRAHPDAEIEVIGVVRDIQDQGSEGRTRPVFYSPFAQSYSMNMTVATRLSHSRAGGEILAGIRSIARDLDPNLPLYRAGSYAAQYRISLLPQRIAAGAIGAFGLIGLLMATLGIYGVLAFHVGQRTPEIGVRLALGAQTGEVVGLVLRQGLGILITGLVVGLALALGSARLVAGFVHSVDPGDLLTFIGVPVVLIVVALLACWVPARRATEVDPMVALREE